MLNKPFNKNICRCPISVHSLVRPLAHTSVLIHTTVFRFPLPRLLGIVNISSTTGIIIPSYLATPKYALVYLAPRGSCMVPSILQLVSDRPSYLWTVVILEFLRPNRPFLRPFLVAMVPFCWDCENILFSISNSYLYRTMEWDQRNKPGPNIAVRAPCVRC